MDNNDIMVTSESKLIKIKKQTYDELTTLGKKNETYDDIIQRLIRAFKENNK
jgi:predicted CopG family antitoxin